MKKYLIAMSASLLLLSAASAQAEGIAITPAGKTPAMMGDARNFSGRVAVEIKSAGNSGRQGSVGHVDFMPGARTAWHTHPAGQLLIVTDGRGWVQEAGRAASEIKAGDVVWIEPGVKHWHGAAQDSRMSHIAVSYMQDGKAVEWMELVSDEQYNAH